MLTYAQPMDSLSFGLSKLRAAQSGAHLVDAVWDLRDSAYDHPELSNSGDPLPGPRGRTRANADRGRKDGSESRVGARHREGARARTVRASDCRWATCTKTTARARVAGPVPSDVSRRTARRTASPAARPTDRCSMVARLGSRGHPEAAGGISQTCRSRRFRCHSATCSADRTSARGAAASAKRSALMDTVSSSMTLSKVTLPWLRSTVTDTRSKSRVSPPGSSTFSTASTSAQMKANSVSFAPVKLLRSSRIPATLES
ncbi:hypothetical protein OCAE111667_04030 [Occultella aeris]|uniref:Uncharacterized protein n=1 Tax=Occultella aeris TaxID=2761496 RepID=A0A7M4DGA8_9MICO|nr:hypothetical protein HALOF300_01154 [Occultella aeris]